MLPKFYSAFKPKNLKAFLFTKICIFNPMPLKDYFQITPFSSLRMVNENPAINPRYGTFPIDDIADDKFYAQPWRKIDINCRIQVMTPYSNDAFTVHHYDTDVLAQTVPLVPISPALLNQPFVCVNGEIDLSALAVGLYYAKYTYTDENNVVQDIRSNPINVQDDFLDWDGTSETFLYEATNNSNSKGVIFINGSQQITFAYRIPASWYDPLVKGVVQNFEDERYNLTQESYIPYETRTNYTGIIPFWQIKKLNLAFSLDNMLINGENFASTGEDFKPTRPTNQVNQNGYWAIDVQKNENYNFTAYKTGNPPPNTFKVIALSIPYPANTGNITVSNVFKNRITLAGVNVTANAVGYTMIVGTTVGGNDIGIFDVPVGDEYVLIDYPFSAAKTVYFTIPSGTSGNIDIHYYDFTAPNFVPPVTTTKWVTDTLYTFVEMQTPLATAFNVATGLGNTGTDWENCILVGSIADTTDIMGTVIEAWNPDEPTERGVAYGNETMLLDKSHLPNFALPIRIDFSSHSGGSPDSAAINQGDGTTKAGLRAVQLDGGETPFSLVQPTTRLPMFYYKKP